MRPFFFALNTYKLSLIFKNNRHFEAFREKGASFPCSERKRAGRNRACFDSWKCHNGFVYGTSSVDGKSELCRVPIDNLSAQPVLVSDRGTEVIDCR